MLDNEVISADILLQKHLLLGTSFAYDTGSILRGIRSEAGELTLTQLAIAKTG